MTNVKTRRAGNSNVYFSGESDAPPTDAEVGEAQSRAGYSPWGYGGPWGVQTFEREGGGYVTTWRCAASCD